MEPVPAYLAWYFLRIRKHGREEGYFLRRFDWMPIDQVAIEEEMNRELHDRGLIELSDEMTEKTAGSLYERIETTNFGTVWAFGKNGRFTTVYHHLDFEVTARGRYFPHELAAAFLTRTFWIAAAAAIGVLIGIAIDH